MTKRTAGTKIRNDGTIEKRFTVEGKRYSVYGKTGREVIEKELELRRRLAEGSYTKNKSVTLDKYFEEWKTARKQYIKGNSIRLYSSIYNNHISPVIGKRKVIQIERREVLKLQSDIAKKSVKTANYTLTVLGIILSDAVRDEIIQRNPAAGIKAIKEEKKAAETKHRALTETEQRLFMKEANEEYLYNFLAFLLSSGTRTGEAAALTWNDIDYINNVIHINKTATFTAEGKSTIGSPKSAAGKRDIPLTDNLKKILSDQRNVIANGIPTGERQIFTTIYGNTIKSPEINRTIKNILKRLSEKGIDIEPFTAHALRDTFATRFIEQGGQPQTLKTILGHSSLAMTMDLYAHVLPNTKAEEMNRINITIA